MPAIVFAYAVCGLTHNYALGADSVSANPPRQPSFTYVDGNAVPGEQRYDRPPAAVDPSFVEVEQLKDRVLQLEERIEIIEKRLAVDEAQAAAEANR